MHELSLCGAIADITQRRANGRGVGVVHVQIGQLRQVVPDTLTFCWSMVTAETDLDGSVLVVDRIDASLRCRGCGHEFGLGPVPTMTCERCLGSDIEIAAGEEFLVTALELTGA